MAADVHISSNHFPCTSRIPAPFAVRRSSHSDMTLGLIFIRTGSSTTARACVGMTQRAALPPSSGLALKLQDIRSPSTKILQGSQASSMYCREFSGLWVGASETVGVFWTVNAAGYPPRRFIPSRAAVL